jgi:predicted transglutaminase-like cysteine proteinase
MRAKVLWRLLFFIIVGIPQLMIIEACANQSHRLGGENIELLYGEEARERLSQWEELIRDNKDIPEIEKLKRVNNFFNQMRFLSDQKHWGKKDYWATPTEFLTTNGGDCEDFTIAKYFTLTKLGVGSARLRLTYVKALKPNPVSQSHMVLTYFTTPDAEPLVLDNLVKQIRPAHMRKDLVPVYSFNGDGLWLAKERGQGRFVGSASRISRWKDLLKRMRE